MWKYTIIKYWDSFGNKFAPASIFLAAACLGSPDNQHKDKQDRHFVEHTLVRNCQLHRFRTALNRKMVSNEKSDSSQTKGILVESTLAIIKPDAVYKSDEIEEIILQHGFTILQVRIELYIKIYYYKAYSNMVFVL